MPIRHILYPFVVLLAFSNAVAQAPQRWVQYASGTGFYINRAGDLITNAHVVRNCQSITVRTPSGDLPARLVASDTERDLALLRTSGNPPATAPLRWNIADLRTGDTLYVYGFPGKDGARGIATFVRTTLSAMHGPTGEPEWLQLQSASQQGNSGGPVLDASGNVIAVIFRRAEIYDTSATPSGEARLVGSSGVAITLRVLQDFLSQHMAGYHQSASGLVAYAEPLIFDSARQFTFPVLCMQGVVVR